MLSDLEIAQLAEIKPIKEIAKKINHSEDDLELYGKYKAKIDPRIIKENKNGKLILVTAINPTPAGEGKSTTTIGLADALNKLGKLDSETSNLFSKDQFIAMMRHEQTNHEYDKIITFIDFKL